MRYDIIYIYMSLGAKELINSNRLDCIVDVLCVCFEVGIASLNAV